MIRTLALPLVVVAAAVAASSAGASSARMLQLVSVQQSFAITPAGAPTVGSRMIFTQAIYNRVPQFGLPRGARVGRAEVVCTIVSPTAAQCLVTAHVPTGQIVALGAMTTRRGPVTTRFSVLGGGTVVSKDVSDTKSLVTIELGA
jgi:hypothetical protein